MLAAEWSWIMSNLNLWLAGAAWLIAGVTQAGPPEAQANQERPTIAQREAAAPTAGDDAKTAGGNTTAKVSGQALPTDVPPVNEGDCDGR